MKYEQSNHPSLYVGTDDKPSPMDDFAALTAGSTTEPLASIPPRRPFANPSEVAELRNALIAMGEWQLASWVGQRSVGRGN
jgi:hypothetical protein